MTPEDGIEAALTAAVRNFNEGRYFDAGEQFELLAAQAQAELKSLLEALNRVAAALHLRFNRGGRQASINLLAQAAITLEDLRPARAGIDVERLCQELHAFTEDLRKSPREFEAGALRYRAQLFLERRRAPRIVRSR